MRYSRFHDQLLATGGSDHSVNLWSLWSASSAPANDLDDDGGGLSGAGSAGSNDAPRDHLVATYDDHDDSVYSVRWWVHGDASSTRPTFLNPRLSVSLIMS